MGKDGETYSPDRKQESRTTSSGRTTADSLGLRRSIRLRLPARTFLQTRIARRVFGLFLLCAVVPAVTLAASGYWLVSTEMRSQAGLQLAQASKISGTLLLARLHAAGEDLDAIVTAMEAGRGRDESERRVARLRAVSLETMGHRVESVRGERLNQLPEIPLQSADHLQRGRATIVINGDSARPAVYLVRRLTGLPARYMWAEVNPSFLWGDREAESFAPAGVEFCVYALPRTALHCSQRIHSADVPDPSWRESEVGASTDNAATEMISGSSSIFLAFEYAAAPWQVVLQQPAVSITTVGEFRRSVTLTLLTGLALVVLASNILLRQSLDPVVRLQEGTRRIAAGDFSAPVEVKTGDEFEELAGSFNAMATGLRDTLERLNAMSWGTLEALARTIDASSPWTSGHSERVTRIGIAIGRQMGLPEEEIDRLHRGGLLHDVGKIGIPASVLDKPGQLDPEEFAIVRAHPVVGARILEPIHAYHDVIGIVRHHHERYDGEGYPDRLAGDQIPFLARVLAVADVFDALVSDRPYRSGWSPDLAIQHIGERAGSHFDPTVVRAFLDLVDAEQWIDVVGKDASRSRSSLAGLGAA